MADSISVLIVDDLIETRENVRKLLQFESDIEVIGQAGTGEEAIEMAKEFQPDIILMDINMPGIDGIGARQKISDSVPSVQIIIMSVQSDPNYLRRAMMAGARDFLTKPFGGDELVAAVRRVHEKRPRRSAAPISQQPIASTDGSGQSNQIQQEGRIISVFSPKGGAGCTTIAINVAVTLAKKNYRTVLVDGSLQFGDVEVMLNMKPMTSIVDVSDENAELDADLISSVMQLHRTNVHVLLAPPRPEMAEMITEQSIKNLLAALRLHYDFIIIDTSSYLTEVSLAILDIADRIILIAQQSLPNLKSIKRFFDLGDSLDYSPGKSWLVVNRTIKQSIPVKNIGKALKQPIIMDIPEDAVVSTSANQGVPLVVGANKGRPISISIMKLADHIIQEFGTEETSRKPETAEPKPATGFLGRLFSRRVKAGG